MTYSNAKKVFKSSFRIGVVVQVAIIATSNTPLNKIIQYI